MTDKNPKNRDPITDAPGAHPVGTGVGAAGGGMTGAAIGAVAGPVGAVAGAVIGAVAGGLAGKGVAEAVNPTVEEAYWRESYSKAPYYETGRTFDDYGPAYELGYKGRPRYNTTFEAAEPELRDDWNRVKNKSKLNWEQAKHASRAAWDRVERAIPGDSDRDGK